MPTYSSQKLGSLCSQSSNSSWFSSFRPSLHSLSVTLSSGRLPAWSAYLPHRLPASSAPGLCGRSDLPNLPNAQCAALLLQILPAAHRSTPTLPNPLPSRQAFQLQLLALPLVTMNPALGSRWSVPEGQ